LKALSTLLLASLGSGAADAQTMPCDSYRFTNDNGVPEISNSIPPELSDRGYSCIKDGKVVQVVPPKRSPTEQAKRDRDDAAKKAAKEAGLPHQRSDEELEMLYATPGDVEDARARKIPAIDRDIATTRANVESLKLRKQDLEEKAANREREGLSPSTDILDSLENATTQIADKEQELAQRLLERQHAIDQFEFDLDGMKRLHAAAPREENTGDRQ
jgi:hypothetical protein